MAETLKDIIEKLKAQKEAQKQEMPSQISKPKPQQSKSNLIQRDDEEEEFDMESEEEGEEEEKEKPKPIQKPEPIIDQKQQQAIMEIEMLQNDGRFRAELLFQLQELNKALVTIADILLNKK